MTSDITTLTVEQIMRDRGIGKRYAYTLLRREQAKRMEGHVPQNQRDLILTILAQDTSIRNTNELSEAIHATGSKLPPHDVTKTLWSLQKSRYVRFRERANGMLYAIELTSEGRAAAAKREIKEVALAEVSVVEEPPVPAWTATIEQPVPPPSYDELLPLVEETYNASAPAQPDPAVPWFRDNMGGWPSLRAIRDRYQKAVKIRAAAALLEEVGEDDTALALFEKVNFTPLEEEVIQLLRWLKEIE